MAQAQQYLFGEQLARWQDLYLHPENDVGWWLEGLAWMSAIEAHVRRSRARSVHHALLAGATLEQLAAALGVPGGDRLGVARLWIEYADDEAIPAEEHRLIARLLDQG